MKKTPKSVFWGGKKTHAQRHAEGPEHCDWQKAGEDCGTGGDAECCQRVTQWDSKRLLRTHNGGREAADKLLLILP